MIWQSGPRRKRETSVEKGGDRPKSRGISAEFVKKVSERILSRDQKPLDCEVFIGLAS